MNLLKKISKQYKNKITFMKKRSRITVARDWITTFNLEETDTSNNNNTKKIFFKN